VVKSSAGDDAMEVRMEDEVPAPRVYDGADAEQAIKPLGIGGELQECLAGGGEQQVEEERLVRTHKLAQLGGKSEDDVEVRDRQCTLHALGHPARLAESLALGAVPIATRVEDFALASAFGTDVAMSTEGAGTADRDIPQRSALHGSERVGSAKGVSVAAKERPDVTGRRVPPPGRAGGDLVVGVCHRSARSGRLLTLSL
jgi:hypothetical protein